MWETECRDCGGNLYVVGFKAGCRIPLCEDGFSTADATFMDTEDEVVSCGDCGKNYRLEELSVDTK